ncbi:MAG: GPW/gp25 family protein [Ktedonobacteraceae bacterium]
MSTSRYRAWKFIHPDLSAREGSMGLTLSSLGGVAMIDDLEAVSQAILLLLTTSPGERVMRPEYGCQLHRLVFSPNDETTAGLAMHYVRQALERWEPRVEIVHLNAERNREYPEYLTISLAYQMRATQQIETTTFFFNLAGGKN